jgi:hypothetical protein
MHIKRGLAWSAVVVAQLIMLGSGFAAPPIEQLPMTPYMRSAVGTPNELSPVAPEEARKVRKVGNQWTCEINGQPMVYNDAASRWEPQPQGGPNTNK